MNISYKKWCWNLLYNIGSPQNRYGIVVTNSQKCYTTFVLPKTDVVMHHVATCPSAGGWRGAHGCVFQERKMRGVATNVYLRKTSKKPERCGLRTLSVKGSRVVFMHGEGISTPRVRHKGRQPLIKCANMTSKCFIFPFFMSFCVFMLFVFFYLFVVDKGVSLAPTYPQLRWGNQTYVVL